MGSYTVISEAGNALVCLLREKLVPEMIQNKDAIGLASPAEHGDFVVCIHLYDVSESEDFRLSGMVSDGMKRQKFPPMHLTLSYMITVFSSSDIKFRSEEEQRILGRIIQILRDYPVLNLETMEFDTGTDGEGVRLEMRKIELEEKLKVWNFPNLANRLSLFYKLGPLPLESARTKEIQRVRSIEFKVDEQGEVG